MIFAQNSAAPFVYGHFGGSVWESNPLAIRFTCRPTVLKTAATTRCANTSCLQFFIASSAESRKPVESVCEIEFEIIAGVLKADVSDQFSAEIKIVGYFSTFHVATDQIAEAATKVFVAAVREKRARVGQHADELRKHT